MYTLCHCHRRHTSMPSAHAFVWRTHGQQQHPWKPEQLTNPAKDEPSCNYPYKEIIGSLMYAAIATQPDIVFMTSILAQFTQNPTQVHWEATKRVVRYLKTTHNLELTYGIRDTTTVGYSDVVHASQLHRHSISGYAFLIGRGA